MSGVSVISSTQNEFVKMARSLKDKKGRVENRAFLVEGEKCVNELLENAPHILRTLIVVSDKKKHLSGPANRLGKPVVTVEPHVMKSICDCKTPQYIAAVADIPMAQYTTNGFIIALDDVSDPANIGTIIRTADAAGCSCVVLSPDSADPYSPKAVRASMGSLFHLPVIRAELGSCLGALLTKGYEIACADLKGDDEFQLKPENTCLVIGNESRGISEEILSLATALIRIPIYGKAESLNAAVAAGILIYKIRT